MLRRLYRQRRRFAVVSLLLTFGLAASMASGAMPETPDLPLDRWITWIALFLTALIVTAGLILITTYVLPALRHALEVFMLMTLAFPAVKLGLESMDIQLGSFAWLAWILTFVAIEHLLYGRYFDRLTFPLPERTVRFRTKAPPRAAWAAIVTLPENSGRHFYPGTRFEPMENGSIRAIYPLKGGQTYQVELITPDVVTPPTRFTAHFVPAERTPGSGGLAGSQVVDIAHREDGGSDITITERRDTAPIRRHLQLWLDDELGDRADYMRARIDGRHDWSLFKYQFPKPDPGGHSVPA